MVFEEKKHFLDAQASLAPSHVCLSVGNTFEFPLPLNISVQQSSLMSMSYFSVSYECVCVCVCAFVCVFSESVFSESVFCESVFSERKRSLEPSFSLDVLI